MAITIYHNPKCSKSRQTLALLTERGHDPNVIEYLTAPPTVAEIGRIVDMLGISPRQLMRSKEAKEVGLDGTDLDDAALIAGMAAHPRIIQRPIVVSGDQAAIGRPPEAVLEIL